MIFHDRVSERIDPHVIAEKLSTRDEPRTARRVREQRLLPYAPRHAVVNTRVMGIDDVASPLSHQIKLTAKKVCLSFLTVPP